MEAMYLLEQFFKEKGYKVEKSASDQITVTVRGRSFWFSYGGTETTIHVIDLTKSAEFISPAVSDEINEFLFKGATMAAPKIELPLTKLKAYEAKVFELADPNSIHDILALLASA